MNLPLRIENKIEKVTESGCWIWTGYDHGGYGRLRFGGKRSLAHRVVFELTNGPVPEGLELDHLCRVRCCVNPDHLEPVHHRENMLRGDGFAAKQSNQTHCLKGHEFTKKNTYIVPSNRARVCRACNYKRSREWLLKQKEGLL